MREINLETWDPTGKKVLLYSGGMDSWLIDKIWKPDIKLFIDINTNSSNAELEHLPNDVVVTHLRDLGKLERKSDFILPLRNAYLILMATNYGDEICLGANATDATLDKTYEFAEKFTDLLNYMYGEQKWTKERKLKVTVDFREFTKPQLLALYIQKGGDPYIAYKETFSCFTPIDKHEECHNCRACFLKFMAFEDCGVDMSKYVADYVPYIKEKLNDKNYQDRIYSKDKYEGVLRKYGY